MSPMRTALLCFALCASGAVLSACAASPTSAEPRTSATSRSELNAAASQALENLYRGNPAARDLSKRARAVLIFPNIVKGGLGFGGAYGEGELRRGSMVAGRYNSVTASWGLQAGAQSYSYAVFLMTDNAIEYLDRTEGWEIGVGPTVVVADSGVAENISTSTEIGDAVAFIFDQQGLMAGVSIEGTKITRLTK